jgi:hypothetical protein
MSNSRSPESYSPISKCKLNFLRGQARVNRGEAAGAHKQMGVNSRNSGDTPKLLDALSVLRDSEWTLDDFMRTSDPATSDNYWAPQGAGSAKEGCLSSIHGQNPPGGPPAGESGEVLEIKFDVTLRNDEERQAFARTQRTKLAKMLGLSPEDIEILDVKPGSPVTIMRFQIGSQEASRIRSDGPRAVGDGGSSAGEGDVHGGEGGESGIDSHAILVDMVSSAGGLAHQHLSERLRTNLTKFAPNAQIRDSAGMAAAVAAAGPPLRNPSKENDSRLGQSIGRVVLDSNDSTQQRVLAHERAKGVNYEGDAGAGQEYANFNPDKPCEQLSRNDTGKEKAWSKRGDAAEVQNSHMPGREMMIDGQYSSAKVQRRAGNDARRMKSDDLVQEMNHGLHGKVGVEECADTARRKESEDELNFLPAQRGTPGSRSAIVARKDDGLEASNFTGLREHTQRIVEKAIDLPTNQPSFKLEKSYEECNYVLKNKVHGYEAQRTDFASQPLDLGDDARKNKKKGKGSLKLNLPAVPEAYLAFGQDGVESKRLLPGIITLENPAAKGEKEKKLSSDDTEMESRRPELLMGNEDVSSLSPDIVQIKFDVAFVDDEARQAFAFQQGGKLAALLQLPEHFVCVRSALPGSPVTLVTFEIVSGAAVRSMAAGTQSLVRTNRPFDSAVLEVKVVSAVDKHASALVSLMTQVVGNTVPVQRMKGGKVAAGGSGAVGQAKNVKFDGVSADTQLTPAYQRSRQQLEAVEKRQSGPLISSKEIVDNDSAVTVKRQMKDSFIKVGLFYSTGLRLSAHSPNSFLFLFYPSYSHFRQPAAFTSDVEFVLNEFR